MAFFSAQCRLDGAFFASRRRLPCLDGAFPCGIPLERAVRIDVSNANCRAKSHFQVRTSERNPIFRCPPLRCPPLGPSKILKSRKVTIRGAQPSAKLSEEICLSEGCQVPLRGSLRGSPRSSAGVRRQNLVI